MNLEGYVVDLDKDRLQRAPHYASPDESEWRDPAYGRRIDDYYGPLYGGIAGPVV